MNNTEKLDKLGELSEADLRRDVLIPLLGRLRYQSALEYHGPREHGKDILSFEIDRLGDRRYLAVVAKTGDLSGSASARDGLMNVLNQTEQCFNEPYLDLFGMRSVQIHEVWIVTAGRVVPGAADSVFGRLKKSNLDKLTRIISGTQLVDLIDKHYPTYWQRSAESSEYVRAQRDRHRLFLLTILHKMGTNEAQITEVLDTLAHSERPPVVYVNDWTISAASSWAVHLRKASVTYPPGMVGRECGNIQRAFEKARHAVREKLYEIDSTLFDAEKVLGATEPREFLKLFYKHLKNEYPFWRPAGSGVPSELYDLETGIDDADTFLSAADTAGIREAFARQAANIEALEPQVSNFLRDINVDEFILRWTVDADRVFLL